MLLLILNIVKRNLRIFDIVQVFKAIIPDLEFQFINQHIRLDEVNVMENKKVNHALKIDSEKNLEAEIKDFIMRFSY